MAYDFAFSGSSAWISPDHYRGIFDISLLDPMTEYVAFSISNVTDNNGNLFVDGGSIDSVFIDTELPLIINAVANEINLNVYDLTRYILIIYVYNNIIINLISNKRERCPP